MMTSVDFIIAVTSSPSFKPNFSADSLVITAVIVFGSVTSILMFAITAPTSTFSIFPFN